MSEQNKKMSAADTLRNLDSLARNFNNKAIEETAKNRRVAEVLESAALALREEQAKNRELQHQLKELQVSTVLKQLKLKGKSFIFLIDGSSSMTVGGDGFISNLRVAYEGVKSFTQATGVDAKVGLWGDSAVSILKDADAELRAAEKQNFFTITNFCPVIEYMKSEASVAKKSPHFVVLSDGDIFDSGKALVTAQTFLKDFPKVSIDFVILSLFGLKYMKNFEQELQKQFPKQVGIQECRDERLVIEALTMAAAQRTQKVATQTGPKPELI